MVEVPQLDRPVLTTERLELWLPTPADVEQLIAIITDPHTSRYLGPHGSRGDHLTRILRNVGSWLVYGYGNLVVKLRGDAAVIGTCGIFHTHRDMGEDFDDRPEAGWILASDHAGKGYASEAMAAMLEWFASQHGGEKIVCVIEAGNDPSFALARNLGFAEKRRTESPDGRELVVLTRSA